MIKIDKATDLPKPFLEYALSQGATFENMNKEAKQALRIALLTEQKFICAYCNGALKDDPLKTKIEHFKSQFDKPELQLDYSNLLICCLGNQGKKINDQTCDTRKANLGLKFSPTDQKISTLIDYENTTGIIKSRDQGFSQQLDEVLNLNLKTLQNNRKAALNSLRDQLRRGGNKTPNFAKIKEQLIQKEKLREYIGIVLVYLDKKIVKK